MKYKVIAFTGSMGSGKTEAAKYFQRKFAEQAKRSQTIKFAQPMYDIQSYIYQVTHQDPPETKDRKLLQFIGTEWGRTISPDLWVNIWYLNAKTALFFEHSDAVLVDDCRFDNEAMRIKELGGAVIKLHSDLGERSKRIPIEGTEHISEKGVDSILVTANVYNNGSLSDFYKNLDYLFETLNSNQDKQA